MKKLSLNFLTPLFIFLWVLYTIYTVVLSIYEFSHMRYVTWSQAENKSSVYSSRRSTTVTYNFIKNKVRISRKYPGIFEGANTWIWGINKKEQTSDISFFIKKKDFKKIENKEIDYRKDIFGGKLNELESIPFFGLRTFDVKANKIALLSDIWKYNYSWWIFIVFFSESSVDKIARRKNWISYY